MVLDPDMVVGDFEESTNFREPICGLGSTSTSIKSTLFQAFPLDIRIDF